MRYENKRMWFSGICIIFLLLTLYIPTAKSQEISTAKKDKTDLLIMHSFDSSVSDYPYFNKLVTDNLAKRKIPVNTRIFYLDCDAYGRTDEILRIYNYLDTISIKPDVILACDDQATYSLLESRHPILKNTPVIFSGVNFPNWPLLQEYPNVTGIWDNPDYEKNVQMIEKLLGIKRIRFFYDKTYNGKRVIERLAEQYKDKDEKLYQSLAHFVKNGDSIPNVESDKSVYNWYLRGNDYSNRPEKTTLYFINMRGELGQNLLWNISGSFRYSVFLLNRYDYTIAQVGRFATVPTFSAVNRGFTYNQGILGGYFTPIEYQVDDACDYISRVLKGENISRLPVKESRKKYLLDWDVLNRWNIPIDKVPQEFEVVNIPFYVKYKIEAIIFSTIFVVCIVSLVTYLLFLYRREARRKRQAQLNLWEEKEFLSLALEGGSVFAWRYNNENNEFCYDHEFLESLGMASPTMTLKEITQKTHPEDLENSITTFINVVNRIENRADLRTRIDFNGKGYVWYEFRFLNVSGIMGDQSSVIGLVMDIQDFKNKEDELIKARDLASKAELKQSFLANMSHEIRTPLNAIVGFSNILVGEEENLSNEDKLEYIRIINQNCELLLKLINDILEISRIESGSMSFALESCNLNELVDDIYKMCQLQTPTGIKFIKNIPEKPLYIETDAVRLKQVVANFINNAFKFTSSGYVAVGMDRDEEKKEVCIYVEDTGVGIPEEQQKLIFDRFYKIDEFSQGTGLGLSICQVIAYKLGGRITLDSEVNKGTRLGIVLPYGDKPDNNAYPTVQQETATGETEDERKDLPVVLIAEDSVSNYMVLNNILKKFCTVVWAINGKDALEIIRKRKVNLVLMDIKMHEMDGITALTKIRKSLKKLPVIIQTAYAADENRKRAEQAGASGFIVKPIRPEMLLTIVGKYIPVNEKSKE